MKKRAFGIIIAMVLICAVMAIMETVVQPGYWIKACFKAVLFSAAVLAFGCRGLLRREGLVPGLALGGAIFAVILLGYFLFRSFIDLEAIADGLVGKEGICRENFLWVALYISLCNSLLEELLFRGLGYLELRKFAPEGFAMVFSAAAFAAYHVAILDGWFSWWMYALCMAGLFVGGLIFNFLDRRGGVLPGWLAHAGANLAINTIGLTMFGLLP